MAEAAVFVPINQNNLFNPYNQKPLARNHKMRLRLASAGSRFLRFRRRDSKISYTLIPIHSWGRMRKPYPHRRRIIIQYSFPNNKLSTRPRKKKVKKQKGIDCNLFYLDTGNYSPVSTEPLRGLRTGGWRVSHRRSGRVGDAPSTVAVNVTAQPIFSQKIGRTCGIGFSQGVRVRGHFADGERRLLPPATM